MNVYVQHPQRPSQVLFAFDEVADPTVWRVRWAAAYVTKGGSQRLVARMEARLGAPKWAAIEKHIIASLDFGLTEPDALQWLSEQPRSHVWIAQPEVLQRPGLRPADAYHPKVFLFDRPEVTGYVAGSANLTNRALVSNTEVVTAGHEVPGGGGWNAVWEELRSQTVPLTPELLQAYREKKAAAGPPPIVLDPPPPAEPPGGIVGSYPIFWDAVLSGSVSPTDYRHFWVEAGSMSSGGSKNQLEMPRGGNRFFNLNHGNYGAAHSTIGYPPLTLRNLAWQDRPLTWHGNNGMERLNLPTLAQGGFSYPQTAVLFRRHAAGFEIEVAPWTDAAAVAWRAASESQSTLFRLGQNSQRLCGLF